MVTKKLEIFRSSPTTFGVVLKTERKFQRLNNYLKAYPQGTKMLKGEEVLFRVSQPQVEEVRRILGLITWPALSSVEMAT